MGRAYSKRLKDEERKQRYEERRAKIRAARRESSFNDKVEQEVVSVKDWTGELWPWGDAYNFVSGEIMYDRHNRGCLQLSAEDFEQHLVFWHGLTRGR